MIVGYPDSLAFDYLDGFCIFKMNLLWEQKKKKQKKKNTKAKKNLCLPLRTARAIGSYVPAFALIKTMQ